MSLNHTSTHKSIVFTNDLEHYNRLDRYLSSLTNIWSNLTYVERAKIRRAQPKLAQELIRIEKTFSQEIE